MERETAKKEILDKLAIIEQKDREISGHISDYK